MKTQYDYRAKLRSGIFVVTAVCAIGISSIASSQEILNPNQIVGKVVFANANPEIRNILSANGFNDLYLSADSVGTSPVLNHYTYPTVVSSIQAKYQLTVETSSAGIPYNVKSEIRLGKHKDKFIIWPRLSPKVYPEPAADVVHDIYQCASMLDIKFVDKVGNPAVLNGGSAAAYQEKYLNGKFSYDLQAQSFSFQNGITHKYLAVNGNAGKIRLDVIMESGSDASSNIVRGHCRREIITPRCDQIVPVTCVVNGDQGLGQIFGSVDVLGENVQNVSHFTRMRAFNGPLSNYRYDHVAGSGDYLMENLVPSNAETPLKRYMMYGELVFGTGFQTQYLRTPWLGKSTSNPGVVVEVGKTTNLGNTFVLNPGFISGLVVLAAPPVSEEESFLHDLQRNTDVDHNHDGTSDYIALHKSHVEAEGLDIVAAGATRSAMGGLSQASFEGTYDVDISSFVGDYRMSLGGLKGEASVWRSNTLALRFIDDNAANLKGYQNSYVKVRDNNISNQVIVPGSSKRVDHTYCLNDVVLSYRSLAGTFFNPQAYATGTFAGTDFMGNKVNQSITLQYSHGAPRERASAATEGYVNLALPQGSYEITPKLTAINPDGTLSYAELPPVSLDVACRQAVSLTTNLQLSTDALPLSTDQSEITVSGKVRSLSNVAAIKYILNNSAEVIVCNNCGLNPTYTFNIPLVSGDNKIVVLAEDEHGDVSMSSSFIASTAIVEPEPEPEPLAFIGCGNKSVLVEYGETSAKVDFAIETEGGCEDVSVSCDAEPGDVFPLGSTAISCSAADSCGAQLSCQFAVEVKEDQPSCAKDGEIYTVTSIANINQLWPPNRKFSDIGLIVTEDDPCAELSENSGANAVTTVWSNEPELSHGAGRNMTPDAKDIDTKVKLRAERNGNGNGRVYLLISKGISVLGEGGVSCLVVTVPHDRSASSIAAVNKEAAEAKAYCEANNGSAPPDFYQNGFEHRSADEADEERAGRIKEAEKISIARKAKKAKKEALAEARDAAKAEAEKKAALAREKAKKAAAKKAALLKAKDEIARKSKAAEVNKAASIHDTAKKVVAPSTVLPKAKVNVTRTNNIVKTTKIAPTHSVVRKIAAKRAVALHEIREDAAKAEKLAEAQKAADARRVASETTAILRAIEAARAYRAAQAIPRKMADIEVPTSSTRSSVNPEDLVENDLPSLAIERMMAVDDAAISTDIEAEAVADEDVISADDEERQDVLEEGTAGADEELDVLVEKETNAEEIEAVVEEDTVDSVEKELEEGEVAEEVKVTVAPQEIASLNDAQQKPLK